MKKVLTQFLVFVGFLLSTTSANAGDSACKDFIYGDVNGDRRVDRYDVQTLSLALIGGESLDACELLAADVDLSGAVDGIDVKLIALTYALDSTQRLSRLPVGVGDVTLNGSLSGLDAAKIKQHLAGVSELTGAARLLADVNRNGQIDEQDVQLLEMRISGTLAKIPVPVLTRSAVTGVGTIFRVR